jgi:hypothetical protein
MTLGTQLVRAVQKEAAMQRPLPLSARAQSTLPSGDVVEARVVLNDHDRFSHVAEIFEVKVQRAQGKAQNSMRNAQNFCEKASYLTERLQFVESDAVGNAVTRSTPQTMRGPRSEYFEATIGSEAISLQRFRPRGDKPGRDAVPFCITDEVLERLADDAASVLHK